MSLLLIITPLRSEKQSGLGSLVFLSREKELARVDEGCLF